MTAVRAAICCAFFLVMTVTPGFGRTLRAPATVGMALHSDAAMTDMHGRYYGTPDLVLTSSVIAAGGGTDGFHSVRLMHVLTGQHFGAEVASLQARFGEARVARFLRTFDTFVALAIADAGAQHISLPAPEYGLDRNSYVLAASLRRSGVMPDGRFDIGYMIEHLLSRPMHVRLMHRVNSDPAAGPAVNADFHVVLTAAMNDLKQLYHLPE